MSESESDSFLWHPGMEAGSYSGNVISPLWQPGVVAASPIGENARPIDTLIFDYDYTLGESHGHDTETYRRVLEVAKIMLYNVLTANTQPLAHDTLQEGQEKEKGRELYHVVSELINLITLRPDDFYLSDRIDEDAPHEVNLRPIFNEIPVRTLGESYTYKRRRQTEISGSAEIISVAFPEFYPKNIIPDDGTIAAFYSNQMYSRQTPYGEHARIHPNLSLHPGGAGEDGSISIFSLELPELIEYTKMAVHNDLRNGAADLLRFAKAHGIVGAIASNGPERVIEAQVRDEFIVRNGIYDSVDELPPVIAIRGEGDPKKPSLEFMQRVFMAMREREIDFEPETTVMVGDKVSDVEAARIAGIRAILMEREPYHRKFKLEVSERLHRLVEVSESEAAAQNRALNILYEVGYVTSPQELGRLICRYNGYESYDEWLEANT